MVVSAPPRHGKSELISGWVPIWFHQRYPHKNIIIVSYGSEIANMWGRNVRNRVLEHSDLLGYSLAEDSKSANKWNTKEGGAMYTAGIGGSITGRGGDLIIIDDPFKNWEEAMSANRRRYVVEAFNSTIYTRAEPGATIILLSTRWHKKDLSGYLLNEHAEDWEDIRLPAIAEENDLLGREVGEALCPERYSVQRLHKIRRGIGTQMFTALHQQRPSAFEGKIIKRAWLDRYGVPFDEYERKIISCDMTFKKTDEGSFVCMGVWIKRGATKQLIDVVRKRMGFTETIEDLLTLAKAHPDYEEILVEEKANGSAVLDTLKDKVPRLIAWDPEGSKEARAHAVSPEFEARNVQLPEAGSNDWIGDYVEEIVSFPASEQTDQMDMTSQALLRFRDASSDEFSEDVVQNKGKTIINVGGEW